MVEDLLSLPRYFREFIPERYVCLNHTVSADLNFAKPLNDLGNLVSNCREPDYSEIELER